MSDYDDAGPTATQCHQSLLRPILVFGGERDLVLYTGFGLMLMVIALRSWWGTALAVVLWLLALHLYRLMAARDPSFCGVYVRQVAYRSYYSGARFHRPR